MGTGFMDSSGIVFGSQEAIAGDRKIAARQANVLDFIPEPIALKPVAVKSGIGLIIVLIDRLKQSIKSSEITRDR